MSYADELAGLKMRLITDSGDRRATAERRIRDIEALIAAETVDVPETAEADHSEVETATMPAPRRGRQRQS